MMGLHSANLRRSRCLWKQFNTRSVVAFPRTRPYLANIVCLSAVLGGPHKDEKVNQVDVNDLVSRITLLRRSVASAANDEQYKLAAGLSEQIKALEMRLPTHTLEMLQCSEKLASEDKTTRLEAMKQLWDLSASEPIPHNLLSLVHHRFITGVCPGPLGGQQQLQLETLSRSLWRPAEQCSEEWFDDVCKQMRTMDDAVREAVSEAVVLRTKKVLDNFNVRVFLESAQRQSSIAEATHKVAQLQEDLSVARHHNRLLRYFAVAMTPPAITLLLIDISHYEHPVLPFCHGVLASYIVVLLAAYCGLMTQLHSISMRQNALQEQHKGLGL